MPTFSTTTRPGGDPPPARRAQRERPPRPLVPRPLDQQAMRDWRQKKPDYQHRVADFLAELRGQTSLTQKQLAGVLNHAGETLSWQTVQRYESPASILRADANLFKLWPMLRFQGSSLAEMEDWVLFGRTREGGEGREDPVQRDAQAVKQMFLTLSPEHQDIAYHLMQTLVQRQMAQLGAAGTAGGSGDHGEPVYTEARRVEARAAGLGEFTALVREVGTASDTDAPDESAPRRRETTGA